MGVIEYRLRARRGEGTRLIEVEDRLVGVVATECRDDELYLARIEVSPEMQNLGLGGAIITGLIQLATRRGIPVALDIFEVNPARHLYERLGFHTTGLGGAKVHMRWAPG